MIFPLATARSLDSRACTSGSNLATACCLVLAGCSCSHRCSRTPGSSLATARCLVLAGCSCSRRCSRTPGSSLATARCLVMAGCSCSRRCSRTPGSSLATARCSDMISHPHQHLSCNASSPSVRGLLQTPHYRISTRLCLIKNLGLILQPSPLLLLLMVLTHDLDYVDSKINISLIAIYSHPQNHENISMSDTLCKCIVNLFDQN